MSKTLIYLIFVAAIFAGCASKPVPHYDSGVVWSGALNRIEVGMTTDQVREIAGGPSMKSASQGSEYWRYRSVDGDPRPYLASGAENYFIRFEGGKVSEYGRIGDFNTTRNPTMDVNVRVEE